jgi:hypothetical protein
MEGMKLGLTELAVSMKKASKSSKSGDTSLKRMVVQKPVIDLGSKVCPS